MPVRDLQNLYLQSPRLNQLNILREIALNARITQAELAGRCSLSVAMVNNYMKDLCSHNLLRYHRKSIKNVSYHLTPSGERRLDLLQKERIGEMAQLFAEAKASILDRIRGCPGEVPRRVVLYGSGDLAQLAFLAMESSGFDVLCICDDGTSVRERQFCGRSIDQPARLHSIFPDAVIVTDEPGTKESAEILDSLEEKGVRLIRLDTSLAPLQESLSAGITDGSDYKPAAYLQYREI